MIDAPSTQQTPETEALGLPQQRIAVPQHRGTELSLPRPFFTPDPADLSAVKTWVAGAPRPTAIDLFCGAGGLSLGLQDAGFSVLVGADHDPECVETHVANLRGLSYVGDLADPTDFLGRLRAWGVQSVDLVAGGVPCQPFSRAAKPKLRDLVARGQRSADDGRAHLWIGFLQVVAELNPRAVLLENVPDLATWNDGAVLVEIREGLRDIGYWTDARLLAAQDYGVPQHRARLFVVGLRESDNFDWPTRGDRYTVRDAIGDLPVVQGGQREEVLAYHSAPDTDLQHRLRRGVPSDQRNLIFDHVTRAVRPDDAEAFSLMRPGQTYQHLPARLQRYRGDIFRDKYKRLEWDSLSRTITAHIAKDGYWYIHPSIDRTLSIREAARLQTFPDWYRFSGHPTGRFRQIGNAVPPLLAEALGRSLRASVGRRRSRKHLHAEQQFREVLTRWHGSHARPYPWRSGADAWHVLMAEICLHRTRADQAASVYRRLVELAPTPSALLERSAAVLSTMRPLGLHWRIENIVDVAETLVKLYDDRVPASTTELRALPGVGDYGASAVQCFAFGKPSVLLDTNTVRIVKRVRGATNVSRHQVRMDLYELAGRSGPDKSFNYALLDLGALVCRANKPLCEQCPVRGFCKTGAGRKAVALDLPLMLEEHAQ